MPPQARLGDKALIPADAHGCVACPHTASGPAVAGSPNVNVNGRPAIRVDDPGIHTACCGGNTWNAQTGSKSVFINGKPAHRLGDVVRHCGGAGKCIEGSGNVIVGDSGEYSHAWQSRQQLGKLPNGNTLNLNENIGLRDEQQIIHKLNDVKKCKVDRAYFWSKLPLGRELDDSSFQNIDLILDEWDNRTECYNKDQLAYMLATVKAETRSFKPIREIGKGSGYAYGVPDAKTGQTYYGRGFVQLTWDYNYKKYTEKMKIDLYNHPDLALVPENAVFIMFDGMISGAFTKHKLSDYFNDKISDYRNARKIINGTDRADEIAQYATDYRALLRCRSAAVSDAQDRHLANEIRSNRILSGKLKNGARTVKKAVAKKINKKPNGKPSIGKKHKSRKRK